MKDKLEKVRKLVEIIDNNDDDGSESANALSILDSIIAELDTPVLQATMTYGVHVTPKHLILQPPEKF